MNTQAIPTMHPEFASAFRAQDWLIEPRALRAMIARASLATADDIRAAMAAYNQRSLQLTMLGDVALIECAGPITYKSSWFTAYFGGSSIEEMRAKLRMALADPAVRAIVFRWDTPGGEVTMVPEFGAEIFESRGQKPLISLADTMIASAGYWLAAQTDTIYASPSSCIGSIGVYWEHDDISGLLEKMGVKISLISYGQHKVDGNPYEPLSESVRADVQARVNELGQEFDAAVARGRGVSKTVVAETFGQGKVFRGKQAIQLGLADKAGTALQVLTKLTKGTVMIAGVMPTAGQVELASAIDVADTPAEAPFASAEKSCASCNCPCDGPCPTDCPTCEAGCSCIVPAEDDALALLTL